MPTAKSPGRTDHDKNQVRNSKHAIASAPQVSRLVTKPRQGVSTVQGTSDFKVTLGVRKEIRGATAAAEKAAVKSNEAGGSANREQPSSRSAKLAQTKPTKAWTVEAAGRIASATARNGDGTVKKDSFAANAMSKAMKNEHRRKDNE
jgi:hypothetical protein